MTKMRSYSHKDVFHKLDGKDVGTIIPGKHVDEMKKLLETNQTSSDGGIFKGNDFLLVHGGVLSPSSATRDDLLANPSVGAPVNRDIDGACPSPCD